MSNETDLAWAAGYIEADGSIAINKYQHKSPDHHCPSYSVSVIVSSISKTPIEQLHQIFGQGYITTRKSTGIGKQPSYYYFIARHAQGAYCLRKILPYLKVKRKLARIALRLQTLIDSKKREWTFGSSLSVDEIEKRNELYLQARWLNRKPAYNLIKVEPRCNRLLRIKGKELLPV